MPLGEEYWVRPVVDYQEHTPERPFCGDPTCPCADSEENMETLNEEYQDGLIGAVDGELIRTGRTI